ncbi:class I SAM-dependent methyltransferase [Paenibacillus aurantius]|uniref:Class I SAM-dependent methyltransferase n=1 Tax=Paenibacillus aurantius TaxID=2918900 RepID=A0AA96LF08_9BACL|nr:class I SAM-dependent methyltransferase [Paenibacillus aurantius]WNQ12637.1 class I SAM-dependent methyltransferase [Paenibacillus aurantius]
MREAYNRMARERDRSELQEWKIVERSRYLSKLQEEKRGRLLEIGAGTGRDSLFFQEAGLQVTSADLSEEMVALCREKGLDARVMDFYRLDFAEEAFEAVYALNCLLHVPKKDLPDVLAEIRRILVPGGLFFMGVYGGVDSDGVWEKDTYELKRYFSMYPDDDLTAVVKKVFEVEEFRTVSLGEGTPHFQSLILRRSRNE